MLEIKNGKKESKVVRKGQKVVRRGQKVVSRVIKWFEDNKSGFKGLKIGL